MRSKRLLLYWILVAAGLVVFALRRPSFLTTPTFWGEDGQFFYAAAMEPGWDLLKLYTGQLWIVQRIGAAMLTFAPPAYAPLVDYLLTCAVAVLAFSVVLQQRAVTLFGRFRLQVLAFAVLVLLPTIWEVQGNLANLHTLLAISILIVLVLPRPVTRIGQVAELVFVAVVCLTGLVGLLLSPVALWGAWKLRTRYVFIRSGVCLAAGAVNLLVVLVAGRTPAPDVGVRISTLPGALVRRVGDGMVLGQHILERFWPQGFIGLLAIPGFLMIGLLAYLAWKDRHGPSWIWLTSGAIWLALGLTTPVASANPRWAEFSSAGWRYSVVIVGVGFLVLVRALRVAETRTVAAVGLLACALGFLGDAYLQSARPAPTREQLRAFQECIDADRPPCQLVQAPEGWFTTVFRLR